MEVGGSGYNFKLGVQELAYGCLSGLWSALSVSNIITGLVTFDLQPLEYNIQ